MPQPRKGEDKKTYINRCTKDLIEKEKRKPDQARAICESYWDKRKKAMSKIPLIMQNFLGTPFAILPAKLEELLQILQSKNNGELLRNEEFMAQARESMLDSERSYPITKDGIATINVQGTLSKRMNMLMALSGGASYQVLTSTIEKALADDEVKGIFFYVDSPGGAGDGLFDFTDALFSFRGRKPMVAFTDGQMASAAYIAMSAADYVVASNVTNEIGSIGVLAVHADLSKKYEMEGIKPTVMKAGKYKALGNRYEPLSKKAKDEIQEQLDFIYSLVVDKVAAHRRTSIDYTNNSMAQGRLFNAKDALSLSLIDEIMTKKQTLNWMRSLI